MDHPSNKWEMISIKNSQVPNFLRGGSFYNALSSEEEDSEIQIPEPCYAHAETIETLDDFAKLLKVTAFWGLDTIPTSMIEYCCVLDPAVLSHLVSNEEYATLGFAQDLTTIFVPKSTRELHNPLVNAITIGRSDVVYVLSTNTVAGTAAAVAAAENGRLDYLKLLQKHGHAWDETACDKAAAGGHLDCLQYLHKNDCPWNNTVTLSCAVNAQLDCMKYAHEHGLPWHSDVSFKLAENGNLEMLQYAIEHGCIFEERSTYLAARGGHLECQVNNRAVLATLEKGHLTCLKLLIADGRFPMSASWPSVAAYQGHFHIVQYLHESGCPWDKQTADAAARGGHFDILCYAIQHNGGYDYENLAFSSTRTVNEKGLQCLKCLIEQRGFYVNCFLLLEAFIHGNYLAVKYLFTKGPYIMIHEERRWKIWSRKMRILSDNDTYDSNLQKCFACALDQEWDVRVNAPKIMEIVGANCDRLPLCVEFLNQWPEKDSKSWSLFCFF